MMTTSNVRIICPGRFLSCLRTLAVYHLHDDGTQCADCLTRESSQFLFEKLSDEEFDQVADMFYCPDATFVPSFSDSFFLPQEAISGVLEGAYTGIQLAAPGKKFILKSVAAQVKNDEMIEEVGAALVEGIPGASGTSPWRLRMTY